MSIASLPSLAPAHKISPDDQTLINRLAIYRCRHWGGMGPSSKELPDVHGKAGRLNRLVKLGLVEKNLRTDTGGSYLYRLTDAGEAFASQDAVVHMEERKRFEASFSIKGMPKGTYNIAWLVDGPRLMDESWLSHLGDAKNKLIKAAWVNWRSSPPKSAAKQED